MTAVSQHFNPWTDKPLSIGKATSEKRFLDAENRYVFRGRSRRALNCDASARALWIRQPKIPALLVDFRDGFNPRKREMSRRALQDVTRNVLSLLAIR